MLVINCSIIFLPPLLRSGTGFELLPVFLIREHPISSIIPLLFLLVRSSLELWVKLMLGFLGQLD